MTEQKAASGFACARTDADLCANSPCVVLSGGALLMRERRAMLETELRTMRDHARVRAHSTAQRKGATSDEEQSNKQIAHTLGLLPDDLLTEYPQNARDARRAALLQGQCTAHSAAAHTVRDHACGETESSQSWWVVCERNAIDNSLRTR